MSKPTKLRFKGDDKKSKRKRKQDDNGEGSSRRRRLNGDDDVDDADGETWVFPATPQEIRGPVFIVHNDQSTHHAPLCIAFDSTRGRVTMSSLDKRSKVEDRDEDDAPPPQELSAQSVTPTDVSHVWVATRPAGSNCVNLRTGVGSSLSAAGVGGDSGGGGNGKFLSCDAHGLVSCFREARGPQEEWTTVILPPSSEFNDTDTTAVAFLSPYETYLSVDEAAGGVFQLRADATVIGPAERFTVKVQASVRRAVREEEREKVEGKGAQTGRGSKGIDEVGTNHMYQTWGAGKSVTSKDDKKELKKAQKEGRLSEALLDRRSKLKSDRFC